jgi:hypothetical protein
MLGASTPCVVKLPSISLHLFQLMIAAPLFTDVRVGACRELRRRLIPACRSIIEGRFGRWGWSAGCPRGLS